MVTVCALPVHMYVVNTMTCAWVDSTRLSTGFGADCYSEPVRQLELAELFKQLLPGSGQYQKALYSPTVRELCCWRAKALRIIKMRTCKVTSSSLTHTCKEGSCTVAAAGHQGECSYIVFDIG